MIPVSWESLIEECLAGDERAWTGFVRAAFPLLTRIFTAFTRNPEIAQDLSQQLLLRLLEDDCRRLRAFDPVRGAGFPVYLSVLAGNLHVDWTRSRQGKDRRRWIDLAPFLDRLEAPDGFARTLELESAMDELQSRWPRARLALDLRMAGCSDREIASALGLTVGGAGKAIWEARRRLREIMETEPGSPPDRTGRRPGVHDAL